MARRRRRHRLDERLQGTKSTIAHPLAESIRLRHKPPRKPACEAQDSIHHLRRGSAGRDRNPETPHRPHGHAGGAGAAQAGMELEAAEHIGVGRGRPSALPQGYPGVGLRGPCEGAPLAHSQVPRGSQSELGGTLRPWEKALDAHVKHDFVEEWGTGRIRDLLKPLGLTGIDPSPRRPFASASTFARLSPACPNATTNPASPRTSIAPSTRGSATRLTCQILSGLTAPVAETLIRPCLPCSSYGIEEGV